MKDVKLPVITAAHGNPTRRDVVKWMVAAAGTISMLDARSFGHSALPSRIGSDPNLLSYAVPWPKTLTKAQLRATAALCDAIIPADNHSPSASAVGVADFIDEWVSAPYEQQQADRGAILEGLAWLDAESNARFKKVFAELDEVQAHKICDDIHSQAKAAPEFRAAAQFFARFRNLTVGAFYTTPQGMADLQYLGNVPLASFDGPPPQVMKHLGLV